MEPELSFPAFSQFDAAMDNAIYAIVGADVERYELLQERVRALRSLPLDLGGLRISRYAGLVGEQACLLARSLTYEFLDRNMPGLLTGTEGWHGLTLGATEEPARGLRLATLCWAPESGCCRRRACMQASPCAIDSRRERSRGRRRQPHRALRWRRTSSTLLRSSNQRWRPSTNAGRRRW